MWLADNLSALDQYFMGFRGHHAAFVVALLVFVGSSVALGVFQPKDDIRKRIGADCFSTDTAFGYRPAELYAMLDRYRSEDYKAHKLFIFLDLIYPLLYSVSLAIMLGYLIPLLAPEEHTRIHYLTLLPLAAAVFDVLENLSMLLILNLREGNAAGRSDALACFSSAMTMTKLVLVYATLLLTVVGILLTLLAVFTRRKRPAAHAA